MFKLVCIWKRRYHYHLRQRHYLVMFKHIQIIIHVFWGTFLSCNFGVETNLFILPKLNHFSAAAMTRQKETQMGCSYAKNLCSIWVASGDLNSCIPTRQLLFTQTYTTTTTSNTQFWRNPNRTDPYSCHNTPFLGVPKEGHQLLPYQSMIFSPVSFTTTK